MPKQTRKVSAPVAARRPKTRRDSAMPHYDTPASVPRSMLAQLDAMRRCIHAADGSTVSDGRRWVEIDRSKTTIIVADDGGQGEFRTEDGRRWAVIVQELKS